MAPPIWLAIRFTPHIVARCAGLNHRATTMEALGNAPASPAPNRNRTTSSGTKPLTVPVRMVNADHHPTMRVSISRGPRRSPIVPVGISNTQ